MAKQNKKIDNKDENEYSGARLLQNILENSDFFEARRKIKETFDSVAALPAIEIIKEIAEMTEIPKMDRQQALMSVYRAMVEAMEGLGNIEFPDVKWKNRGKDQRFADPCQWVIDHYSSYGNGLTINMISSHDPSLYEALRARKKRGLWPDGFNLPTVDEANSEVLSKFEGGRGPSLNDIAKASPPHVREMIRLHAVARSRKYGNSQKKK